MVDNNTDFFKSINNFNKIENVKSISIFTSRSNVKPKFTIAIPTYNRPTLLKETIESAINQKDYTDYDILIVDNNPERGDETEQMMIANFKDNPIISYYKNEKNIGMCNNWNRAFELARGIYLAMIHDDDLLYEYFLAVSSFYLKSTPNVGILKPQNSKTFLPIPNRTDLEIHKPYKLIPLSLYRSNKVGAPSGIIFNRTQIIEWGGFNEEFYPSADYCFFVHFAKKHNVYTLDIPLSYYRTECNDTMNSNTQKGFLRVDSFLVRQLLREYKIPTFIINNYISSRAKTFYKGIKHSASSNYDFSVTEIGLKETGPIARLISHAYMRLFWYYIQMKEGVPTFAFK